MLSTYFQKNCQKISIISMLNLRLKCAGFYDMGITTSKSDSYLPNLLKIKNYFDSHQLNAKEDPLLIIPMSKKPAHYKRKFSIDIIEIF